MTSSDKNASGGEPTLEAFLERAGREPSQTLAEALAVATRSTARLAVFALQGESDEDAAKNGRILATFGIQAFELEYHGDGLLDADTQDHRQWRTLAARLAPLSVKSVGGAMRPDRYASFLLAYDLERADDLILLGDGPHQVNGRPYQRRVIKPSLAAARLIAGLGGELAEESSERAAIKLKANAFLDPDLGALPYDGTEYALVMHLGSQLGLRPLLLRGRWLESEQNNGSGSVGDYLEDAIGDSPPGLYLISGEGWVESAIPYERDADAGFDGHARPYQDGDGLIFGVDHPHVIEEALGQLEEEEEVPEFLR